MIGSDLLRAGLLVAIPVAWAADVLTLPLLLGIVLVLATATLVDDDAASQSFVPRLVAREQLQRAHARTDSTDAVAQTAGPALGELLVRLVGAPATVLVDAATYLFSAVTLASLRVDEPPVSPPSERHLRREVAEGLRWVYRGSGLRDLAVWTHVWFAAQAVLTTVLAPYVLVTLGVTPLAFGLVTAAAGVGGLGGALVSTRIGARLGTGGAVILAHAASTLAVAVMLPDALQARTNTTMRSLNRAVVVVVAPVAGVLADRVGITPALVVATSLFAAATVGLLLSPFRRVRSG
jgi:predicted MFS family arabinose efflux permease